MQDLVFNLYFDFPSDPLVPFFLIAKPVPLLIVFYYKKCGGSIFCTNVSYGSFLKLVSFNQVYSKMHQHQIVSMNWKSLVEVREKLV
jgi:hypothetical protein